MAVLLVLVSTVLLGALGGGLVTLTSTETLIAANVRDSQETLYAAEAAADRVVQDLQQAASWDDFLGGAATSAFVDATLTPTLASNRVVSLTGMTSQMQAESNASASWGANDPQWRLMAYGPLDRLVTGGRATPAYVVAWLADDPSETDGNPQRDTNDVVFVRARALGRGEASRTIELTVAKDATGGAGRAGVRTLSWRVVR
jgi:hypothetical protein